MTEPVTLTAAVIANLAFQEFLKSSAGEAAKQFTADALTLMSQLRQKIRDRLRGKHDAAEQALTKAEAGDQQALETVATLLGVEMLDEAFAGELRQLAQEITLHISKDNNTQVQNNYGGTNFQNSISGGEVYQGNVTVNKTLLGSSDWDRTSLHPPTDIPNNLPPSSAGTFVGREPHLSQLHRQLQNNQLQNICFVHAEMDEYVIFQRVTTLEVVVSGKEVIFQTGPTSAGGKLQLTSEKPLIVQAIPKENFTIIGDDRIKVDPPSKGDTHRIYFDLRPTHLGEGEVWVVIYQRQMPLLTLRIKPQIVETKTQIRNMMSCASIADESPLTKLLTEGTINDYPLSSEPLHQLRIIEQLNGNQITYRYEFESPSLGLLREFESKPITSDRHEYVKYLYDEIESRWVSNADDAEAFTEELRAFGGSLFDELFPSELRSLLWDYHTQLDSIMVLSTEPFIPWELIHLKQPGKTHLPDKTIFLAQIGLVRWLYGSGRFPPENIQIRRGKVSYIIPHYPAKKYRLPQAEKEQQFLEDTFQALAIPPNSQDVRRSLQTCSFDLLHFAGHGTADQGNIGNSKLMMEGRIEGNKYIHDFLSATTVGQFSKLKSRRPIVVLNACQIGREGYTLTGISGFAEAFLKGGAGAFVGSLWSVGDSPAKIFTETFYKELVKGMRLSEATIRAREAAKQASDSTWLAYAVYGHPNLQVHILDLTNSVSLDDLKKQISSSLDNYSSDKKEFVGRSQELHDIHKQVQNNQHISITAIAGKGGIGKTQLALQYAISQLEQEKYPGGFCWLRARDQKIAPQIVTFAQTKLGLTLPYGLNEQDQVDYCWEHWREGDALVVLDDVTEFDAVASYLPPSDPKFKVLITTRLNLGSAVQSLFIEALDDESALELLESLVGADRIQTQLEDAKTLCVWVDNLPFGLELLGRFLANDQDLSIPDLLRELEVMRFDTETLLKREDGMTAQQGVATVLELIWKNLEDSEKELACWLGMFAIAPILWANVESGLPDISSNELVKARNKGLLNRNLIKLIEKDTYQLHQIVQEYFRVKLHERSDNGQSFKSAFYKAMVHMAKCIDYNPAKFVIQGSKTSIPHLEEVIKQGTSSLDDNDLIWPFIGIGRFYEGQGNYDLALPWYQKCLEQTQQRFGNEHLSIATSLNNLAALYKNQGRYEKAEPFYTQALEMYQKLLGNEHPDVATSMWRLGALYQKQGRLRDAEGLYQKALVIFEEKLGNSHSDTQSLRYYLELLP